MDWQILVVARFAVTVIVFVKVVCVLVIVSTLVRVLVFVMVDTGAKAILVVVVVIVMVSTIRFSSRPTVGVALIVPVTTLVTVVSIVCWSWG